MQFAGLHIDIVFVFFIYGLAFFSMGIALALETSRAPMLAERRALVPLAVFGLLHGIHEWIEIILLQGVWLGVPFPPELSWLRVAWLAISFVPLLAFGILMVYPEQRHGVVYFSIGIGLFLLYIFLLIYYARLDPQPFIGRADALARYLLAVPGGILAGLGLRARARQVQAENRPQLARYFQWAALGFGLYGLTQIFVPPADIFIAPILNSETFLQFAGFPVQVVRAAMAILVTINLLRAIQFVEREREGQLLAAQQARLEALEQIQRDLIDREALRRELLRHTVIAQEEERGRIARELHDETAQFLTALSLNLATLRNSVPRSREVNELLDRLQSLSRQIAQGVYRLVHDLRPAQLDDLGLVPALQYLADEEGKRSGLQVSLQVDGSRQRLDPLVETVFFRVAQEALTNVARHAQCDHATVELHFASDQVILRVRDEGLGLRLGEKAPLPKGWGLAGMHERAESVGGKLELSSPPQGGTVVEVTVPMFEFEPAAMEESTHGYHPFNVG